MEEEKFYSGYCRCLDASRMVEAIFEAGKLTEIDCNYGNCLYESNCPIAKEIMQTIQNYGQ